MTSKKVDKIAPKLSASTPSNNKKSVDLGSDITFKFNEDIQAGKGNITITDGEDTRVISIIDKQIKISGKTLTINPTDDLFPNSHYTVKISAEAISDLAGNNFVSTKVPLNFFTKNGVKPTLPEQPKPPVIDEKPVAPTDNTAPVFIAAKVNGTALILSFDDTNLLNTTTANPTAFNVLNNGAVNPVTDVFVNPTAKTVALILTNGVLNGETVTVSYTDPSPNNDANALQDLAGNDIASFSAKPVTNNTLVPVEKLTTPETSEVKTIDISGAGNSDASAGDSLFKIALGDYTHTITGFGKGDVIDFPDGQMPTLKNENLNDGKVDLQYASSGQVVIITLTGLENDVSLYSINSFNAAFGLGSIQ